MNNNEKFKQQITRYRNDPLHFVRNELGVEPDPWQAKALQEFPFNQRTAMKACKGPGKTALLAWLILNFLSTRPYPKIAATSITGDNLGDNLWPEIAKWQNKSEYLKREYIWTKTRVVNREQPENWFASARTWPRTADADKQADTLAGLHADYLMFVLDESGGIPMSVMAAAEAGLSTGVECHIVQAGNPTHLEGPLYAACTNERHLWNVIEITGDPDDPNRSSRISMQWAKEQIDKFGRDNPWVLVNVFGKFPPSSINTLLGPDDINPALGKTIPKDTYDYAAKLLGVDVARFGDDRTVIFPRQGLAAFKPTVMRNARTHEIAARVALAQRRWGADAIFVDDTGGWGAGVIDSLLQAGYSPIPVNNAGKATDPRYYNKRAENYFAAAEWVKRGGALPNVPELVREATVATYTIKNGKFLIEDKDQIKDRLGYSPDYWDAFTETFAVEIAPPVRTGIPQIDNMRDRLQADWDPHNTERQPDSSAILAGQAIETDWDPHNWDR